MNEKHYLYCIHNHFSVDLNFSGHFIISLFDLYGPVEADVIGEICEKEKIELDYLSTHIGSFQELSELKTFAFLICDKLSADGVRIFSMLEFNKLLESLSHCSELKEAIKEGGELIENPDREKKRSFLGRFF